MNRAGIKSQAINKQYEQLIADYLAGEPVDDLLIEACKNDTRLCRQLADDVAFNRIVSFAIFAKDDEQFMDEIAQQLANNLEYITQFK